jgi:hypothetical protein
MPNTGWTIQSQVKTMPNQSVTINTNGFNIPGALILTVSNGICPNLMFQYQINRSFTAPAVAIAPVVPNNNCLEIGSTNHLFSISASAAANPTTWTVTPAKSGVTLVPGTPNSTVAVNVGANATVGTYTLTAKSTSCGGNVTYSFRVKPKTPTLSGNNCITQGSLSPQTYTCVASPGATYTWAFPAGWTAPSFTTSTPSITVTPGSAAAVLNGTVTVTANGTADCNSSATFPLTYASAAPTGVTTGCFSFGIDGGASVTFANPLPGNYTATMVPTGGGTNVITGPVTLAGNTLSFTTSALAPGTYNLTLTHSSGCGAPASSTTTLTVAGNGTSLTPNFGTPDNYYAFPPGGMMNPQYVWSICGTGNNCDTVGGNSALLTLSGATPPPPGNQVCVTVYPLGSTCKTRLCTAQGTHSKRANPGINGETMVMEGVAIYPNPNSGDFRIRIADFEKGATATLYDLNGKRIKDITLSRGVNKMETRGLAKGTYLVVVKVDGRIDVTQVMME